ncbi:unnamed protein product [Polarella glacialis]|uniref:Uncharacterized protein n=1 Tax=Polarella glacialis TaxID=89957 RepID=A0A813HBD6_POLGL|nr:unnamed protein product [Polarella glacialis]
MMASRHGRLSRRLFLAFCATSATILSAWNSQTSRSACAPGAASSPAHRIAAAVPGPASCSVCTWVEERLRSALAIEVLQIQDLSDGHTATGFTDGSRRSQNPSGLELQLTIVSPAFDGLKLLDRQLLVTDALGPKLRSGAIHSLPSLRTFATQEEWKKAALAAPVGCTGIMVGNICIQVEVDEAML